MILYVLRHAEAIDQSENLLDEWRYLTKQGRSSIKKLRSRIVRKDPEPNLIITSPLVRAVQTAEIVAEKAQQKDCVIASGFLLPGVDTHQLINHLKNYQRTECVMLVGHEPLLGLLVAELLGETSETIQVKKAACVALQVNFDKKSKNSFLWYMPPDKKRITQFKKAFL
jgi:phosphohistidine phosphatase